MGRNYPGYQKTWLEQHRPEAIMLYAAKNRAKKYNLEYDLEESDIIIPEVCPILGIPLVKGVGRQSNASPSLDRRDTTKGYVKGNVYVISNRANRCKSDLTPKEVENLYRYVFGLR